MLVARESGRTLYVDRLPEESAISVVTLAELEAGVLAASGAAASAARLATLTAAADILVLPIDEAVASVWAQMRVHLVEAARRVNVNDLWIAATAAANGLPVVTQDDDFDALEGVAGLSVVKV